VKSWKFDVETCATISYLLKTNKFLITFYRPSSDILLTFFLTFFLTLPSSKTMSWPWNLGYEHALQRPFSKGGGQSIHRLRPPSLYRVKRNGAGTLATYTVQSRTKIFYEQYISLITRLADFFRCVWIRQKGIFINKLNFYLSPPPPKFSNNFPPCIWKVFMPEANFFRLYLLNCGKLRFSGENKHLKDKKYKKGF